MNNNKEKLISVKKLYKNYNSGNKILEVLKNLNLDIYKGSINAIIGESGCGKSTLLHLLGALDDFSKGSININGQKIEKMNENQLSIFRRDFIGFIFQFHYLLPDFTALENVMLPYLNKNFNKKKASKRSIELLKEVGMDHRLNHKPKELSGGEQQKIAIARALINFPTIIFADEPTGNLDEKNSTEIQKLFWDLSKKYNLTIILVTHNLKIANASNFIFKLAYGQIKNISHKEVTKII